VHFLLFGQRKKESVEQKSDLVAPWKERDHRSYEAHQSGPSIGI